MARDKGAWSSTTYERTEAAVASSGGPVTALGEERVRTTGKLDKLVDPKSYDVSRSSNVLLVKQDDGSYKLILGVPMPVLTAFDTTGSMGGNVDIAFRVVPDNLRLLALAENAVLRRYNTQLATGIIQDAKSDRFAFQITQFEPDNAVEQQMTLLDPQRGGGDSEEDYLLALYYAINRVKVDIRRLGLKGYFFVVGDEEGFPTLESWRVKKALGLTEQGDIPAKALGKAVLQDWHAFYLQVGNSHTTTRYWEGVLGKERIIVLPQTEDIALVQAVVIGLTEGQFDAQGAREFLTSNGVSRTSADKIVRAVSRVPAKAQTVLPGFANVPEIGASYDSVEAFWAAHGMEGERHISAPSGGGYSAPESTDDKEIDWLL